MKLKIKLYRYLVIICATLKLSKLATYFYKKYWACEIKILEKMGYNALELFLAISYAMNGDDEDVQDLLDELEKERTA